MMTPTGWRKISAFILALLFLSHVDAQTLFTMDAYLDDVREANFTYKGTVKNRDGAKERLAQSELLTAFKLESNYQLQVDKKLSQNPALTYDSVDSQLLSLGVSKKTSFGLDAKLSYEIASVEYINPNVPLPGGMNKISSATPTLRLTQSLWQNGFGSLTRAQVEATASQIEYERLAAEANLDALIQKATVAYWNLAFQRETVAIQRAAVKQAESIYDYNSKRSRMNLADRADSLQAKAMFESTKLDLQTALDEEEVRLRAFNLLRNKPPHEPSGRLSPIDLKRVATIPLPDKRGDRADVKAARAQAKASAANYKITEETNDPVLDVYGSYSLNGRAEDYGKAISDSYSANRPTTTVGVNFSLPLDFGSVNRTRSGARAQAEASETIYRQKALDQEAEWQDLKAKVTAVQNRVKLSEGIVKAQLAKLEYERTRLRQGRTSTYQVLLFENDYINARLTQMRNASELVSLLSQLRLYRETTEGTI